MIGASAGWTAPSSAEVSGGDGPWDGNDQWRPWGQGNLVVAPGTERTTVGSGDVIFTSLTISRYEIGGPILEILDQSCLHEFNATGITPRQRSEFHAAAGAWCHRWSWLCQWKDEMVNTHRVWSLRAGRPVMISTMMCSICQCCC